MSLSSTLLLKVIIGLLALATMAILLLVIPYALMTDQTGYYQPILWGLYVTAIPFFIALYQVVQLLGNIDRSQTFSINSVNHLKKIKQCGLAISILFTAGMPYVYYAADQDDAPGVVLIGVAIIGGSFLVATIAALLQRLLQNAVDIKSENDLTV